MPHNYSLFYREHPLAQWEFQTYLYMSPNDATLVLNRYRQKPKPWTFPAGLQLPQWTLFDHNTHSWFS